jgi:hypothetical protein
MYFTKYLSEEKMNHTIYVHNSYPYFKLELSTRPLRHFSVYLYIL